ncbi:RNA-binding protein [Clostridia bacterium]|nr:RNA-binding protein [Clostridia bacterium]
MEIAQVLANELEISEKQVKATIALIDEGNTIPFIARYRKEATGSLDDELLRKFDERLRYLRNLEEKKTQVLHMIKEQGKLTIELEQAIWKAVSLVQVEDLYRPFRPKKRTRATIAKEKGLEPLAEILWQQEDMSLQDIEKLASAYLSIDQELNTVQDVLQGAKDILAEKISDEAEYREYIRKYTYEQALLCAKAKDPDKESVYEMYYAYQELLKKIPSHRILALNRGEKEKFLTVYLELEEEGIITYLLQRIIKKETLKKNNELKNILEEALIDSYRRLIAPSIEREIRNTLTEQAENGAIGVFGKNLMQLLMQPPITGNVVLGWDPAFRTGCKLAVVDEIGKVLDTVVIYPTAPQNKVKESKKILLDLIQKHQVSLIALGNGTASRESEQIIVECLKDIPKTVQYVVVNEAGASVYSASALATEEFPNFDVGQRSAISIARRLQDPLAELVKIDSKSIGVGQYQHDMNQKKLGEALDQIVEECVNKVGVDVNTASVALLSYAAGITKTIAKNIVNYREENGAFQERKQLLKVAKLGPKSFEQCAGFLRIRSGKKPLDATAVHPESYSSVEKLLERLSYSVEEISQGGLKGLSAKITDYETMAKELALGEITLRDIVKELEKPGRDPREEMPKPILREDILEIKDLSPGLILKGTVRNVIDFGAFVDIGVHQDGLVHISEMTQKYIKHPLEVVSVGDVVEVTVLSVDIPKKRIQLSMKR